MENTALQQALSDMNKAQRELIQAQDQYREAGQALVKILAPDLVGIMTPAEAIAIGGRVVNRTYGKRR